MKFLIVLSLLPITLSFLHPLSLLRPPTFIPAAPAADCPLPGTASIDTPWDELGFEFRPSKSHVKVEHKNGSWGAPVLNPGDQVTMHVGATALHYGQACFEGLKAFAHKDGSVHLFRAPENAARMQRSGERTVMPFLEEKAFVDACKVAVKDNMGYVPPFGSGGALYLRPLLFGSGPRIGLQPSDEYTFLCMVIPVGDYYKGGLKPVDGIVVTEYDRAAPKGVGSVKVAGNYAADLLPNIEGKKNGYPILLYLDSSTQTLIEEFSTSNFIGINHKTNTFVSPKSSSVLPSITNKSLQQIATDMGMNVENREILVTELSDFDEVIACGTAVVVTPIGSMTVPQVGGGEKVYKFGDGETVGKVTMELYNRVRAIQQGEAEDVHGWLDQVC